MITFETQEDFEEAVKAVIRGCVGLDSVAATYYYGTVESGYICLRVDGEGVSSTSLG